MGQGQGYFKVDGKKWTPYLLNYLTYFGNLTCMLFHTNVG